MWCRSILVAAVLSAASIAVSGIARADDDPPPPPAPPATPSPIAGLLPGGSSSPVAGLKTSDDPPAGVPAPIAGLVSAGGPLSGDGPLMSADGPLSANGRLTAPGGPLSMDGPLLTPSSPVSPLNAVCGSNNVLKSVTSRFASVIPDSTLASMQAPPANTKACPQPAPEPPEPTDDQPGN